MTFFIITRLLDILTTLMVVGRDGIEIEANPIIRKILAAGIFHFLLYQAAVVFLVCFLYPRSKIIRIAVRFVSWLSVLIVISNLFAYFLVYFV